MNKPLTTEDIKQNLKNSCKKMYDAIDNPSDQIKAEAMANLYKAIKDYMDTGVISYEAVDSEIIRLFGENY